MSRRVWVVIFPAAIVLPIAAYQLLVNHLPAWVVAISTGLGWAGGSLAASRIIP